MPLSTVRMRVSSEVLPGSGPIRQSSFRATATTERNVYGRDFWCAYVANTAMMVAVSLLYRYADFVTFLGGDEWNVGLVVGTGMVGSLFMRSFQGFGIDHFGARRIWLWSMVLFSASLAGHLAVQNVNGPV